MRITKQKRNFLGDIFIDKIDRTKITLYSNCFTLYRCRSTYNKYLLLEYAIR